VTKRKKKILIVQTGIFILAFLLIYFTYYNKESTKVEKNEVVTNEEKSQLANVEKDKSNTFENVEYKGIDLNGNRYVIKSEKADFELEKPELINMKIMSAIFYFKDGTILKVKGNHGAYNNKTNDMWFKENIIVEYEDSYLYSNNLDYLNTKNLLSIYGNVHSESIQGKLKADNLKFDLSKKTLDISMFDDKQVNVTVKN
tara:strand:- start:299 stop:898 length:600 start_codon:yes stop_codon:yes gene_type:complete